MVVDLYRGGISYKEGSFVKGALVKNVTALLVHRSYTMGVCRTREVGSASVRLTGSWALNPLRAQGPQITGRCNVGSVLLGSVLNIENTQSLH